MIGTGLGALGALGLSRLLANQLFGISATDPVTFAAVSVLLIGSAAVASYIPGRRATRVDPLIALRSE